MHVDLVQSIHDVLFVILLFDAFRAVQGAAVGILSAVILSNPLSALALRVLDLNSVEYLLFDDLEDAGNYSRLQLVRVDFRLLDMLSPQDQLESVLDLGLRAALDNVGYLAPLIAQLQPLLKEFLILPERPLALLNGRVKRGQPSLSALLAVTGSQHHLVPVFIRRPMYKLYQCVVQFL